MKSASGHVCNENYEASDTCPLSHQPQHRTASSRNYLNSHHSAFLYVVLLTSRDPELPIPAWGERSPLPTLRWAIRGLYSRLRGAASAGSPSGTLRGSDCTRTRPSPLQFRKALFKSPRKRTYAKHFLRHEKQNKNKTKTKTDTRPRGPSTDAGTSTSAAQLRRASMNFYSLGSSPHCHTPWR